jgi:hypothetical protein
MASRFVALLAVAIVHLSVTSANAERRVGAPQGVGLAFACPVTQPNGRGVSDWSGTGNNHGNDALVIQLWPGGTVTFKPNGPGFVLADGALSMKFPWWRLRNGPLSIEGRRLDAPAPPLRARIPSGYGNTGFQSTSVIFPTPGCWEVTGHVGDGALTFITRVEKITEGADQGR